MILKKLSLLFVMLILLACNQSDAETELSASNNKTQTKILAQVKVPPVSWTSVGMGGGGGIELPSISPHNKDTVFITTDMSGVYKTENFGENWSLLPFRTQGQAGITDRGGSSPIQFTSDPKILYANHRDTFPSDFDDIDSLDHIRYAVKSTDGGKTFHKLKSPDADISAQVYADPKSSTRLIINAEIMRGSDGEMRILYSDNGGDTFSDTGIRATKQGDDTVLLLSGVHWNNKDIVIATNAGLFVSTTEKISFKKVITNPIKGAIATFTSAKDSNGKSRLFAVTYPKKLGWNLQYPRTPSQMINAPEVGGKGSIKPKNVHVYRMDWSDNKLKQKWQELRYNNTEFLPFWVRTSRNDIETVYLAGLDKNPWTRPSVIKNKQGGLGRWQSIFQTDENQGNNKNVNYEGSNWVPKKPNQNIQSGWAATDGVYEAVNGIIEMSWNWSPNAEGFAIDPNDSARLVFSTNTLHVSEDGGKLWRQVYTYQNIQNPAGQATPKHDSDKRYKSNGLEPTVAWWMEWLSDTNLIVALTDIKGMLSDDGGDSWRSLANTLANENTYKITKSIDRQHLYAATASPNDIYLDHYRLRDLEYETSGIKSCLADRLSNEFMGTVSRSDSNGKNWEILQKFNCPVVWVEVDKSSPDTVYASVVHSKFGGIYVCKNARAKVPVFSILTQNPKSVGGNPQTIFSLENGDLLTSWSVRFDTETGKPVGSGIFRWDTAGEPQKDWHSFQQPKAMDIWTRDFVLHPDDPKVWFVATYNRYNKFSGKSNKVEQGGGGIFRFSQNGERYQRITPDRLYRTDSIRVNPKNADEAYVTTENEGLWKTSNLSDENPTFKRVESFPYRHTVRVFYSPQGQVWVTTFGGGLFRLD
ncbi:MAG: hypothetical protein V3V19_09085 [Cocleimonas sp.]